VVSYDGMIWDQTYGDFGTYEEAQITTAAKGADAMNPGLTMNLVVKSGSNKFKGLGSANYQSGDFQSDNVTQDLLDKGYAPGSTSSPSFRTTTAKSAGRSCATLWFYAATATLVGQLHPGFVSVGSRAGGVLHQAAGSDRQVHLSDHQEQQVEIVGRSAASGSRIAPPGTSRSSRRRTRTRGR
jgi:hypothetical protein